MSPKDDDAGMPLANTSSRRGGRREMGKKEEEEGERKGAIGKSWEVRR